LPILTFLDANYISALLRDAQGRSISTAGGSGRNCSSCCELGNWRM
jgi:hypothetical protein